MRTQILSDRQCPITRKTHFTNPPLEAVRRRIKGTVTVIHSTSGGLLSTPLNYGHCPLNSPANCRELWCISGKSNIHQPTPFARQGLDRSRPFRIGEPMRYPPYSAGKIKSELIQVMLARISQRRCRQIKACQVGARTLVKPCLEQAVSD